VKVVGNNGTILKVLRWLVIGKRLVTGPDDLMPHPQGKALNISAELVPSQGGN
jgi:hypothetical protein